MIQRYQHYGFEGLLDRRRGLPSPKRMPFAVVEEVLCLYREKYFDFSVRHFHEKLREQHAILYSYTGIKRLLQGAGLVEKARQCGPHRRRRQRRPMAGMLLHIDVLRATGRAGIDPYRAGGAARCRQQTWLFLRPV